MADLPVLQQYPLAELVLAPDEVALTQYLGALEEAERKRAVKRTWSAWIPRELDSAIDRLAQDARCGYEHDVGRFVVHAIFLLAEAYQKMGYPDTALGAELTHERQLRSDAERARQRTVYIQAIHEFDTDLDYARRVGDWQSVDAHLRILETHLEGAPTVAARDRLLYAASQSFSLQQAVVWLDDVASMRSDVAPEVAERASRWRHYLEDAVQLWS